MRRLSRDLTSPGPAILLLLGLGPDDEPPWVSFYVQPLGEQWAAMIVMDRVTPPEPGGLESPAFFGDIPAEVERLALDYLGEGVAQN